MASMFKDILQYNVEKLKNYADGKQQPTGQSPYGQYGHQSPYGQHAQQQPYPPQQHPYAQQQEPYPPQQPFPGQAAPGGPPPAYGNFMNGQPNASPGPYSSQAPDSSFPGAGGSDSASRGLLGKLEKYAMKQVDPYYMCPPAGQATPSLNVKFTKDSLINCFTSQAVLQIQKQSSSVKDLIRADNGFRAASVKWHSFSSDISYTLYSPSGPPIEDKIKHGDFSSKCSFLSRFYARGEKMVWKFNGTKKAELKVERTGEVVAVLEKMILLRFERGMQGLSPEAINEVLITGYACAEAMNREKIAAKAFSGGG
ncbi:hypothetical protein CBER1_06268 [Cercospora berteroae]|uniref:Uncharacterized protein n=1 Tax=Cercospora berteroae TaxID=357750 RepID=A0A2S6CCR5_9PEZI|nr:hypothetical protein CBER1_06268 [Cercospora berteroae]